MDEQKSLALRLLKWFDGHARDLPWRRTRDLYAIWVSEIMLQQTQVATVVRYWERFLARFPDIAALAQADEQEVLRLWEGLGYYRRARQLHAASQQVQSEHRGQFPTDFGNVRALPGIGRYTAGAILSIGLDQRLPILEANTIRVLSRLTAFDGDVASTAGQKHLWSVAESILPRHRCGAFNQALMELGSEICTPRSPACYRCPVARHCQSHQRNIVDTIPRAPTATKYEDVVELTVVVRRKQQVLLRQCQPGERWAGLWDFPRFPINGSSRSIKRHIATQTHALTGVYVNAGARLATIKHGVTRFRITLHCYAAAVQSMQKRLNNSARWVGLHELADYPLSVTGRKISRLLVS